MTRHPDALARRRSLLTGLVLALLLTGGPADAQRQFYVGKDKVSIHHDEHGIPHVFGDTDEAALYGLGYHQMIDFPIGTLNMLWLHSGRMAEIAGTGYLDEDRQVRLWEVPKVAARHRQELAEEGLMELIHAYVRGIEDGRKWWAQKSSPGLSQRLRALVGPGLQVHVDPVPNYLNQAFSPFGEHDDPQLQEQIERVLKRLFDDQHPITAEHVLRLGVCLNSFFLYRNNAYEFDALPLGRPPFQPVVPYPVESFSRNTVSGAQSSKISNGWVLGPGGTTAGGVTTLCDNHIPLNKLNLRPYLVQVHGDRYEATGLTMPGYPGVHEGFNDHVSWLNTAQAGSPVARNAWEVTLLPSADPTRLEFPFFFGAGMDVVPLQRVTETIAYYDPLADAVKSYPDVRYYVPVHGAEGNVLGFDRYPVVPDDTSLPLPGDTIQFEQSAFSSEGSPWEVILRMGRARNATADVSAILRDARMILGNGNNLLVADRDGNVRYQYVGRIPRQGSDVPPALYDEDALLDGHQLGWRWAGYHRIQELPAIGPVNLSGTREAWICNNVTPDRVETSRFDEQDLASYPAYMVSQESISTWRQLRAEELLRNQGLALNATLSESAAADVRDTWSHLMWPFFLQVPGLVPGGIGPEAGLLVSWIEQYRSHDENDQPRPTHDFEAHLFSQVTVYAVLLRSHYLGALEQITLPPLTEDQATFGTDALHALYDDPSGFDYASYGPNIDAMKSALETVAAFWKLGTGPAGLVNQSLAAGWSAGMPGNPWGDPRFDTPIDPAWAGIIAGTKVTRWGHTNTLALTPHYLAPPKKQYIDGVGGRGGDPYTFLRGYLFTAMQPALLDTLPYPHLHVPYFTTQAPRAAPAPGTDVSLFLTQNSPLSFGSAPKGYQEAAYEWSPAGDVLSWIPETAGTQSLFSVQLSPTQPARARFLQAIGGTEVTVPDLLSNGKLAHQRRFASAPEFVQRRWQSLETRRANLGAPTWTLVYGPEPTDG